MRGHSFRNWPFLPSGYRVSNPRSELWSEFFFFHTYKGCLGEARGISAPSFCGAQECGWKALEPLFNDVVIATCGSLHLNTVKSDTLKHLHTSLLSAAPSARVPAGCHTGQGRYRTHPSSQTVL